MTSLVKFLKLTSREKRFFLKAVSFLIYFRLLVAFMSLQKILKKISQRTIAGKKSAHKRLDLQKTAYLIKAAGAFVPLSTCLSKSLAGFFLFESQGYLTELHVGVQKTKSAHFTAHAWLTINGTIILGCLPDIDNYTELPLI
jgi:hypothetical protein